MIRRHSLSARGCYRVPKYLTFAEDKKCDQRFGSMNITLTQSLVWKMYVFLQRTLYSFLVKGRKLPAAIYSNFVTITEFSLC